MASHRGSGSQVIPMQDLKYRCYGGFGLKVKSPIPLTEFTPLRSAVEDVLVTYGKQEDWVPPVRQQTEAIEISSREARFWFQGVGAFLVKDGKAIVVSPEPDVSDGLLRLYLQGMMMGTILHQRARCVLHASAIVYRGSAVAMLGSVGAGKS